MLSAIYNYLAYTETTPYYTALMEFTWRTGLLAFPLFDVRERIKNIDGKLVGYVWDRKQNGYSWRLLTSEVVEEEVEVTRNPTQQTGVYGKAYFPTAGINNESTKLGAYIEELLVWKSEEIGGKNRRLGFSGKYLNEARLTELLDSSEKPIPEEDQVVDFDQYIASFSDLIRIQGQNP